MSVGVLVWLFVWEGKCVVSKARAGSSLGGQEATLWKTGESATIIEQFTS